MPPKLNWDRWVPTAARKAVARGPIALHNRVLSSFVSAEY